MERFAEDWPLLQVHRQYGKDEAMKLLFDEISALKFKIGEQASEISELRDALAKNYAPKTKVIEKEIIAGSGSKKHKAWKKDDFFAEVMQKLEASKKMTKHWKDDAIMWRNKYCNLFAKVGSVENNSL